MDVTVHVADGQEMSLARFLDGCTAQVETSSTVRSTLEDLEVIEESNKTNNAVPAIVNVSEVPEKHGK